jgi:hypothetical protein
MRVGVRLLAQHGIESLQQLSVTQPLREGWACASSTHHSGESWWPGAAVRVCPSAELVKLPRITLAERRDRADEADIAAAARVVDELPLPRTHKGPAHATGDDEEVAVRLPVEVDHRRAVGALDQDLKRRGVDSGQQEEHEDSGAAFMQ